MNIEERLQNIYKDEIKKIKHSVKELIESNNSRSIAQKIGRRYGYLWECLLKETVLGCNNSILGEKIFYIEYVEEWIKANTDEFETCCKQNSENLLKKFLSESIDMEKSGLCDFSIIKDGIKYPIESKFSFTSNDNPKVKHIADCGKQLHYLGYKPIMLFRTNETSNRDSALKRFRKNKWNVICGQESLDFILEKTNFDLGKWIDENINVWRELEEYHKELKKLGSNENEWKF